MTRSSQQKVEALKWVVLLPVGYFTAIILFYWTYYVYVGCVFYKIFLTLKLCEVDVSSKMSFMLITDILADACNLKMLGIWIDKSGFQEIIRNITRNS